MASDKIKIKFKTADLADIAKILQKDGTRWDIPPIYRVMCLTMRDKFLLKTVAATLKKAKEVNVTLPLEYAMVLNSRLFTSPYEHYTLNVPQQTSSYLHLPENIIP